MVNVFLCDDDDKALDKYRNLLQEIAEKHHESTFFSMFRSGEELLFYLSESPNSCDILYLDILLKTINGIDVAKRLRAHGCKAEIIFLTTSEDYVYDAFDISPIQYLLKDSTSMERHEQIFLRALSMVKKKETEMFLYEACGILQMIPLRDIAFFEISKRIITIHYNSKEIKQFYGTLEMLEEQLINRDFVRVHRSYLLQLSYITKFEKQCILLKTGDYIPIGITYQKEVKRNFFQYISKTNMYYSGSFGR
ncbi:LytTR family two component transcriptional regulator [Lachnotalea glycerini]|jgi:two-component system, LytTR family, response regulator LytT|uniref:Stage 0 sporulation protein A homolog n=1 Tax=Lachnotalea glycerini TaxID=1763509 RepID=A0A318EIE6_9FIRM|nr:LytTR family DNA-binding domain-containing protein [Lachnotalea glycerini]OYO76323.1 DNA-binding response regulator [Lachnotalea glycerini]PXV86810.1 LytTR family two component transcriptional regulator [Lachnotalea glycerini]RDY29898.1 DNA-binding response regulator [Lachnotalea glycerini]